MIYLVNNMKIAVVGTGMFGFSLAYHLGRKYLENNKVTIMTYDINKELIKHLQKYQTHLYHFGNKQLFPNTSFTTDKKQLIKDADVVIIAVTSQAIRETIQQVKSYLNDGVLLINTSKALESETGKTFSEVISEELKKIPIEYIIAKFSGGTFAEDMVNEAPLGADIACENPHFLKKLQEIFHDRRLRVYGNTDVLGVEYAGAFKNIIAIFAGIINGLGLPYGSETHMISRAAKEAKEIAIALGAKPRTFSMGSQCWGNDMWMSCTGKSRNREYGRLIGSGLTPDEAWEKMKTARKLVEGYYTVGAIPKIRKKSKVETPIFQEIYQIVYDGKKAKASIGDLMNREAEYIE